MRSTLSTAAAGTALLATLTACAANGTPRFGLTVTTIPHATEVSVEPATPADSAEWLTLTPLHIEAGQLNVEVANRTGQEVTVRWGDAALVGLDGSRGGLEIMNLKLDARGELPLPSRLAPYSVVQVRMTPERLVRFPETVVDSLEARRLCEDAATREMRLSLPAQKGRERRVYTMHLVSDVHVTLARAGGSDTLDCSTPRLAPGLDP